MREGIVSLPAALRAGLTLRAGEAGGVGRLGQRTMAINYRSHSTLAALEVALDPADRELDLAIERPPPQWRQAIR